MMGTINKNNPFMFQSPPTRKAVGFCCFFDVSRSTYATDHLRLLDAEARLQGLIIPAGDVRLFHQPQTILLRQHIWGF
jgi:hypothetical protein